MILFPLIVIIGFFIFLNSTRRKVKWIKPLRNVNILFGFLFIWTLFGFFTQEDVTERCGCFIQSRGIFSIDYMAFSAISLVLFILAFVVKNKVARRSLLFFEFAYWIFKLFIIKSGYVAGLGMEVFKYYDFLGLLGRLLLLNSLFAYKIKEYLLCVFAGLLIISKMCFIPCGNNFVYNDYLKPHFNRVMFDQLNGDWTGTMTYSYDSTIYPPSDSNSCHDTILDIDLLYNKKNTASCRDSLIQIKANEVFVRFQDSNLNITKTFPEVDGNYCLDYSELGSKYFTYRLCKYMDSMPLDNHRLYALNMKIEELNDSVLILAFDCGINFELKSIHKK